MWIKYSISFAALIAAGCAVLPAAPLSANHPAHAGASPAPLVQSQILNTYRPAVETRAEPNKNSFTDAAVGTKTPSASSVDHAAMGHGAMQTTPGEANAKPAGTPPKPDMKDHGAMGHGAAQPPHEAAKAKPTVPATNEAMDHAAMGHGSAKTSQSKTPTKASVPAKATTKTKDAHDGH